MPTLIKSVVLAPGESFTLPPNSVLIGSTDETSITSECVIPTLETIGCYVAILAGGPAISDGTADLFEGGSGGANMDGITVNGTDIMFAAPYAADAVGSYNLTSLALELKTLIPGIIATDISFTIDAARGSLSYLLIQTVPSIALDLKLIFRASASLTPSAGASISRISFSTLASVSSAGYTPLPVCPSVAPGV